VIIAAQSTSKDVPGGQCVRDSVTSTPVEARTVGAPDLSIVVPLYNEEESLPQLAREITAALAPTGRSWEVLYVDDGSTDGSLAALRALAAEDPRVRVLRHRRNAGQSAGLATGFRAARGDIVVTLDADLQNDPADIPRLLEALAGGFDVVSGVRIDRRDDWLRRLSSRIANGVRNWATDEAITDVGCSLKAYRRSFLADLPMFTGMHRFLPTLVRWNGARVTELPVTHRPRLHGVAKYGVGNRLFRTLADLLAVRWMRRRWLPAGNVEGVAASPSGSRADP
jgi:dolichol-phosphate mannosyltransferase